MERDDQRKAVIKALKALASHDTRAALNDHHQAPIISAFVTRVREAIGELVMPTTGMILIEGKKEGLCGAQRRKRP